MQAPSGKAVLTEDASVVGVITRADCAQLVNGATESQSVLCVCKM